MNINTLTETCPPHPHIHTHTHIYIYIYMSVCVYVQVYVLKVLYLYNSVSFTTHSSIIHKFMNTRFCSFIKLICARSNGCQNQHIALYEIYLICFIQVYTHTHTRTSIYTRIHILTSIYTHIHVLLYTRPYTHNYQLH